MKRSAQVALVLMGVTGTTATAAYMMPPPRDCGPQQSAPAAAPATNLPPGVTPKQPTQGSCGRSGSHYYRSWSNWGWNSDRDRRYSSGGTPSSAVSTALTNSGGRVGAVSSTTSTSGSSSSASRGGFGSTGRGVSVAS